MIQSIRSGATLNQMKQTQGLMSKYNKQLTTGKKINSAADDAAGLAIANKMLKQIGTYKKTSENITSSISANRIADGALSGISDTYNEMYANSIRAMNGTMSQSDVAAIKQVNDALKDSVGQLANNTKYNEKNVLENIDISFDSMSSEAISQASSSSVKMQSQFGAKENGLEYAERANDIAEENTTAAYSRKVDAEMEKAISAYRTQTTLGQVQNSVLKMQMAQQSHITALFG